MKTNKLEQKAITLEALLPRLMRLVSPAPEEDPLAQLPLGQLRVLRVLLPGPKLAHEIADELGLSASSLSQITQRLATAGLVEKSGDPEDRRSKLLALTKSARKLLESRQSMRVERIARLLAHLPEEQSDALIETIDQIVNNPSPSESIAVSAQIDKGFDL